MVELPLPWEQGPHEVVGNDWHDHKDKGEGERYTQLNTEFQRTARIALKAFLS